MSKFNFFGNISGKMSVLMERTLLLTVNMLIIPIAMVNRLTKSEKPLQKLKNYMFQVTYG